MKSIDQGILSLLDDLLLRTMTLNNGNFFFKSLVTFILMILLLQACSPRLTLQVRKFFSSRNCQVTIGAWVFNANCQ